MVTYKESLNYFLEQQEIYQRKHNGKSCPYYDNIISLLDEKVGVKISSLDISLDSTIILSFDKEQIDFELFRQIFNNVRFLYPNNKVIAKFTGEEIEVIN